MQKECVVCDKEFEATRDWSKYCSHECKLAMRSKREGGEARKERDATYYQKNKRAARNRQLLRFFGITIEDYEEMLEEQNGRCSICGKHHTEEGKALAVDHCHETGKVRGLLCSCCNTAIGLLQDNTDLLRNAIDYLEESR